MTALRGRDVTQHDLYDAIMEGAVERVRPKMMTVSAIMAGLLPILWSSGTGSEVMQRIAVPMVGGMISSTLLTLVVIPAIYAVVKGAAIKSARSFGSVPQRPSATLAPEHSQEDDQTSPEPVRRLLTPRQ